MKLSDNVKSEGEIELGRCLLRSVACGRKLDNVKNVIVWYQFAEIYKYIGISKDLVTYKGI